MQRRAGQVVFSPSDLCRFFESPFASWMDRLRVERPGGGGAGREGAALPVYRFRYRIRDVATVPKLVGSFSEGLYEIRSTHDGNIYRVFFCVEGSNLVLLHGFMKKTQATPARELEVARGRQRMLRRKA